MYMTSIKTNSLYHNTIRSTLFLPFCTLCTSYPLIEASAKGETFQDKETMHTPPNTLHFLSPL